MRKSFIAVVAVLGVVVMSTPVALAQRGGGPGRGGPGAEARLGAPDGRARFAGQRPGLRLMRLGRNLDLSDEQRTKIRAIVTQVREESASTRQTLRETMRELRQLNQSDSADAAKKAELRATLAAARDQLRGIVSKARPEILEVLTPEQKEKIATRRGRRNG